MNLKLGSAGSFGSAKEGIGRASAGSFGSLLYRLLVFRDDDARNGEQIEKAAKRTIAERMKDTLQYRLTLKGHVDPGSGAVYALDTMIRVDDEFADLHEVLWVADRTLRYSEGEGPMTDLVCWRPESFELD